MWYKVQLVQHVKFRAAARRGITTPHQKHEIKIIDQQMEGLDAKESKSEVFNLEIPEQYAFTMNSTRKSVPFDSTREVPCIETGTDY